MKEEFIKGTCYIKLDIKNPLELNRFMHMFYTYFHESLFYVFNGLIFQRIDIIERYEDYPYLFYENNKIVFSSETFSLKKYIFEDEIDQISLNILIKQILKEWTKNS